MAVVYTCHHDWKYSWPAAAGADWQLCLLVAVVAQAPAMSIVDARDALHEPFYTMNHSTQAAAFHPIALTKQPVTQCSKESFRCLISPC